MKNSVANKAASLRDYSVGHAKMDGSTRMVSVNADRLEEFMVDVVLAFLNEEDIEEVKAGWGFREPMS